MILKVISNYKMTFFIWKRNPNSNKKMNGKSCRYELIFNPMLWFRSWLLSWMPEVCVRISSKEKKNPHEEKSCSCKSNIFYLTYLAVSCTYSARWMVHLRWAWSFGCKRSRLLAGPFHEFRSLCMNLLWNPILFLISERSAYCVTSAWQFLHFVCCFAWTFRYWKANSLN